MGEFQPLGTEHLAGKPEIGFFISVLRIPQNRMTQMGAVDPQLMGPSGDGPQLQFGKAVKPLQNLIFRQAGFSVRMNLPQKAW